MKHTYTLIRKGVDNDGWYKWFLRRDDGKDVAVSRKRYSQLNRERRIVNDEPPR